MRMQCSRIPEVHVIPVQRRYGVPKQTSSLDTCAAACPADAGLIEALASISLDTAQASSDHRSIREARRVSG